MMTQDKEPRALSVRPTSSDVDAQELKDTASIYMAHIGGTFPRDMTQQQAGALARLALTYRLDPFGEEIILYQGRPYLTLRGAERIANDHVQYDGMEVRPATDPERQAFRARDEEHLWVATIWRKDRRLPFVNYGRCGPADRNALKDTWGPELAMKRAKHRALRDAFSLPALGIDEAAPGRQTGPAAVERELTDVIDGELVGRDLDRETGEIRPEIRDDQKTAIHAVVRAIGWSNDEYRELLRAAFHVTSSLGLSEAQAAALLETLHAVEGNLVAAVTDEQRAKIRANLRAGLAAHFARMRDPDEVNDPNFHPVTWGAREPAVMDAMSVDLDDGEPPEMPADADEVEEEFFEVASVTDLGPAVAPTEPADGEPMPSAKERSDYDRLIVLAGALGIDLAPYEIGSSTTQAELLALGAALKASCKDAQQAMTGKK